MPVERIQDIPVISTSLGNSVSEIERGGTTYKIPAALAALGSKAYVLQRNLVDPPESPTEGDRYIVASGGINAWTGKDNQFAEWMLDGNGRGGWYFAPPGGLVLIDSEGVIVIFYQGEWQDISATGLITVSDSNLFVDPVELIANDPDASPTLGMRRLIGVSPTGVWVGRANQIAEYFADGWHYSGAPKDGQSLDVGTDRYKYFAADGWKQIFGIREITSAGPITLTQYDYIVLINQTSGAAITLHLPATPAIDCDIIVKDKKRDAGTNKITVDTTDSSTIDGASTALLANDGGSLRLILKKTATDWSIL